LSSVQAVVEKIVEAPIDEGSSEDVILNNENRDHSGNVIKRNILEALSLLRVGIEESLNLGGKLLATLRNFEIKVRFERVRVTRIAGFNLDKATFVFHWREATVLDKRTVEALTTISPFWCGIKQKWVLQCAVSEEPVNVFFKENAPGFE
jgi:hypothetical protein